MLNQFIYGRGDQTLDGQAGYGFIAASDNLEDLTRDLLRDESICFQESDEPSWAVYTKSGVGIVRLQNNVFKGTSGDDIIQLHGLISDLPNGKSLRDFYISNHQMMNTKEFDRLIYKPEPIEALKIDVLSRDQKETILQNCKRIVKSYIDDINLYYTVILQIISRSNETVDIRIKGNYKDAIKFSKALTTLLWFILPYQAYESFGILVTQKNSPYEVFKSKGFKMTWIKISITQEESDYNFVEKNNRYKETFVFLEFLMTSKNWEIEKFYETADVLVGFKEAKEVSLLQKKFTLYMTMLVDEETLKKRLSFSVIMAYIVLALSNFASGKIKWSNFDVLSNLFDYIDKNFMDILLKGPQLFEEDQDKRITYEKFVDVLKKIYDSYYDIYLINKSASEELIRLYNLAHDNNETTKVLSGLVEKIENDKELIAKLKVNDRIKVKILEIFDEDVNDASSFTMFISNYDKSYKTIDVRCFAKLILSKINNSASQDYVFAVGNKFMPDEFIYKEEIIFLLMMLDFISCKLSEIKKGNLKYKGTNIYDLLSIKDFEVTKENIIHIQNWYRSKNQELIQQLNSFIRYKSEIYDNYYTDRYLHESYVSVYNELFDKEQSRNVHVIIKKYYSEMKDDIIDYLKSITESFRTEKFTSENFVNWIMTFQDTKEKAINFNTISSDMIKKLSGANIEFFMSHIGRYPEKVEWMQLLPVLSDEYKAKAFTYEITKRRDVGNVEIIELLNRQPDSVSKTVIKDNIGAFVESECNLFNKQLKEYFFDMLERFIYEGKKINCGCISLTYIVFEMKPELINEYFKYSENIRQFGDCGEKELYEALIKCFSKLSADVFLDIWEKIEYYRKNQNRKIEDKALYQAAMLIYNNIIADNINGLSDERLLCEKCFTYTTIQEGKCHICGKKIRNDNRGISKYLMGMVCFSGAVKKARIKRKNVSSELENYKFNIVEYFTYAQIDREKVMFYGTGIDKCKYYDLVILLNTNLGEFEQSVRLRKKHIYRRKQQLIIELDVSDDVNFITICTHEKMPRIRNSIRIIVPRNENMNIYDTYQEFIGSRTFQNIVMINSPWHIRNDKGMEGTHMDTERGLEVRRQPYNVR